jgi:hypothetical protein
MAGKAVLLVVLGFTIIFIVMGYFWGSVATRSVDNQTSYYKNTIAHNLAVSGANLGLNELFQDPDWNTGYSDLPYEIGLINVTVNVQDSISKMLTSVGSFMGVDREVRIKLMKSSFAKYAWFIASVSTGSKNRPFITGDTLWGGFHSNQFLMIDGDPQFFGKVSTEKGINQSPGSNPYFAEGVTTGVTVAFDKNYNFVDQYNAAQEGLALGGSNYFVSENVWLTFYVDGKVDYRTGPSNARDDLTKYSSPTTPVPLSEMAPTGVVFVTRGNLVLSGTLNGQITVIADQSSGAGGAGNVYLVDDIVYSTEPMVRNEFGIFVPNNSCTDLMGIEASNNIIISSSVESGGWQKNIIDGDIRIHAGIFCASGGFQLDGLGTTVNFPTGSIYLTGSMTAGKEEQVAQVDGSFNVIAGYNRFVVLDERFLVTPPLLFPYSTNDEIMSWYEQ